MTDDVITMPRRTLRLVERAPGIAEVIDMPRRTVGEMAAAAIAEIDRQSRAAEAHRESIRAIEIVRMEMALLADKCIHLARLYDAQGAEHTAERMISVVATAHERVRDALKR